MFVEKWSLVRVVTIAVLLIGGCSGGEDSNDQISDYVPRTVDETGFYGWETVTLKNAFVQLDVVPELGGRIMGYSLLGEQLLWHDPMHEGEIGLFAEQSKGDNYVNVGGATTWPAPQDAWGGPPDSILDGSPYTVENDGMTVTVTSPADTGPEGTGLQFAHRYSLMSRSTDVNLELSMTNRGAESAAWALRHLVTLPADTTVTLYVPIARDSDWEVISGDAASTQWLGIEDGIFRARFNGSEGKVGLKVNDGWAVWHDTEKGIANVIRFPLQESTGYPNHGHQVEIYSTGNVHGETGTVQPGRASMELAILGPLTDLAPEDKASMNITWSSCRCSGIEEVTEVGIVSEKPQFYPEYHILTASFGFFSSGTLFEHYYDEAGEKTSRIRIMPVNPQSEVDLRREIFVPLNTVGIRYELWSTDDTFIGVIADLKLPEEVIRRSDEE